MRAAAYARYSTEHQTENSIDTQLATIRNFCEKNGHILVGTYIDMAMSGTNTERPDFQRMIDGAKQHLFDCVVVYDISRASRDVADWMGFRKLMRSLNIEVLSTTENLGSIDDPNAFLTELLTAGLGQHMVLQTRQKSIAGVATKAKQGVFLGGVPPLGFDVANGSYVINEYESGAIRLIFDLYARGYSYDGIIDDLRKKGYKGKRGQVIGKSALNAILQNERYIGVYTWNKKQVKYMGKWAGGKLNPNVVRIEGVIPAIIDKNTWEKVQNRMKNNKRNASNSAKNKYLLTGLIECGQCGGTYTGKTNTSGKGYTTRYYVCGNKYRNHTCNAKNINADEIELAVAAQIRDYFMNSDFESMADEILKEYNKSRSDRSKEKRELAKIEKEIINLCNAIAQGVDCSELREELAKRQVRKAELQEIIALSDEPPITKKDIVTKLKKDAQRLREGDIERLIKEYVTKIYAHDEEIIITGGVNLIGCGGRT